MEFMRINHHGEIGELYFAACDEVDRLVALNARAGKRNKTLPRLVTLQKALWACSVLVQTPPHSGLATECLRARQRLASVDIRALRLARAPGKFTLIERATQRIAIDRILAIWPHLLAAFPACAS